MNKKIIPYVILPVLGLAILGVSTAFAASKSEGQTPSDALVSALATKFNLNPTEVQTVVDQVKTERRASMEALHLTAFTNRLNQAVADKKLTQKQADTIIAKSNEIKSFMASLDSKTEAERRTAMKEQMDSLKQWAQDNNIPKEYLMFGMVGKGIGHHKTHGMGFGPKEFRSTIK
ncbi:hypothetical protein IPN41_01865 [Candidatus Falkowbacteria bacterium]|nr:MAG: hypothetical protein IPN41_01865 [Candidatus Falkowbacteria bacterium]